MGIRNVNAAFVYWSHLPDRPFRLLIRMCQIANDDTRTYYGGQEMLAQGLGINAPSLPHDDETDSDEMDRIRDERDAAFRRVRRALQTLTDSGVVSLLNVPRVGVRATYAIHAYSPPEQVTQRPPLPVDNEEEEVTQRPTEQVTERPPSRSLSGQGVGHSVTPQPLRNQDEPEPHQENSPLLPTQVSARDGSNDEALSPFKVKEVLDAAALAGINIVAIIDAAPESLTKKTERRAWAAQQIAAKEAS